MIDTTNPRGLADNIRAIWDKIKDISGHILPGTTSATAGQILKLNSDKEPTWADEYSYTPPAYSSTDEVNTGQKWIDGKDIYCKVLNGSLPEITQSTNYTFDTNAGITFIDGNLVCITTGSLYTLNPYTLRYNSTNGAVGSIVTSSFSEAGYRVVYRYTKPDPEPETRVDDPSKDVTNYDPEPVDKGTGMITGEDPEPETKTTRTRKSTK